MGKNEKHQKNWGEINRKPQKNGEKNKWEIIEKIQQQNFRKFLSRILVVGEQQNLSALHRLFITYTCAKLIHSKWIQRKKTSTVILSNLLTRGKKLRFDFEGKDEKKNYLIFCLFLETLISEWHSQHSGLLIGVETSATKGKSIIRTKLCFPTALTRKIPHRHKHNIITQQIIIPHLIVSHFKPDQHTHDWDNRKRHFRLNQNWSFWKQSAPILRLVEEERRSEFPFKQLPSKSLFHEKKR